MIVGGVEGRRMTRFLVRVKRCNRWDVYPQEQPIEECEVIAYSAKWIGYDLAEQHSKWRVASPIIVSVTEIGPA